MLISWVFLSDTVFLHILRIEVEVLSLIQKNLKKITKIISFLDF